VRSCLQGFYNADGVPERKFIASSVYVPGEKIKVFYFQPISRGSLMSSRFLMKSALLSCSILLGIVVPVAVAQTSAASNTAQRRALVTQSVDATKLRTLSGNTRPEANSQNDQGKVDDSLEMDHMMLQLQRSADQEAAVKAFIDQQHDPASPNFHKWLSAEEFGARFGSAPADIAAVTKWLEDSGFTVNTVYPNAMVIDFSGSAGHVTSAFHTEIHKLLVNGKSHIANMSDPQIPAALAPVVAGVTSLHDFRPHANWRPKAQYTTTQSGYPYQLVTPSDLATIYDLNAAFAAGFTGQGQTIAVVEDSDLFSATDWSTFRSTLGLSTYTSGSLNTVHPAPPSGRTNCSDPGTSTGDDGEAVIDAEWASAAAPGAAIQVAACNSTSATFGGLIALQNLVNQATAPQVISMSYGECEAGNGATANATYNSAYQTAVARGISIFVSTGDSGAASCDAGAFSASHGIGISGFASTPYNVAVGGTDFADTYQKTTNTYWAPTNSATFGSALSYIPEIPWNDSCAGSLLATYSGYQTGYGSNGYCGTADAINGGFVTTGAGSGGPSGCATGTPSANFIVGGTCAGYPKPSWQTGVTGIPNDGVRDIPDVSMFAADGIWGHYYVTCWSDTANGGGPCTGDPVNWGGAGGTSFAAPILAGVQALVNQKMGGAQGNPNPVYYKLAASSVASSVFHSVNQGDIAVNCSGTVNCYGIGFEARGRAALPTQYVGNGALSSTNGSYTPAFAANGGWSFATGIGTIDVYNLILNWSKGQ
jgi:subtilase family serine protease